MEPRPRALAVAVARTHQVGRGTYDLASMLAEVDAVYVATPVATHIPLVTAVLRAGRHVLAEKPLGGALDYNRAELLALAEAGGRTAGVAYYRRFTPLAGYLSQAVTGSGPVRMTIRLRAPFEPAESDPAYWRTILVQSGGGVLADTGSHWLDLLCMLFGRPAMLWAELADPFPGGAERRAKADLAWRDGTTARLELDCREGPAVASMTVSGGGRYWEVPDLDKTSIARVEGTRSVSLELPSVGNPLVPVLSDFVSAVAGKRNPGCPLAEAMVVDDLLRAACDEATGRSGPDGEVVGASALESRPLDDWAAARPR
jgi:predicted dehydrogenase